VHHHSPSPLGDFAIEFSDKDPVSTNGRGLVGGYDESHCIQGFQGMGVHWAYDFCGSNSWRFVFDGVLRE
jgi:hypothetical protein